jgi:hypothetical protein
VFQNIRKYWNGNLLKINTVINKLNYKELQPIAKFMHKYEVKEISFTYPDWKYDSNPFHDFKRYKKEVAPTYTDAFKYLKPVMDYCIEK